MSNAVVEEIEALAAQQPCSLVWPVRRPRDKVSYLKEFTDHIKKKFNEPSPNKYARELQDFTNLRNKALNALSEKAIRDPQSLMDLKRYYCQLASILVRFRDSGAEFSWKDAFGSNVVDGDLDFEVNNIMYNIAAVHNELGAKIHKTSESAAKEAISHFTSALWWVTELRDNRSGLKPKEMGHDLLTFYHHILRSQAQEIVLAHSLKVGMNPESVSKISAQIASDYEVAVKLSQTPLYTDPLRDIMLGTSIFNNWKSTITVKHKYFSAMTYLLSALSFSDDKAKEIGNRIIRLKMASELLESCKKLIPDTLDSQSTKSIFDTLYCMISRKLEKAIRFNDTVYHSKLPMPDEVGQVAGKLLITPTPFSTSSVTDFRDLFAGLVTIESVQVTSIYSQKKDEISRNVKDQVEKRDEELAQMMSTLNIDKKITKLPPVETPDELMEICAELSTSPDIVDEVLTKLELLDDKADEMRKLLDKCKELLRRKPNPTREAELTRYLSTHNDVLKTVQSLHKQLYPELQREIQRLSSTKDPSKLLPSIEPPAASENVSRMLENILNNIDDMKKQRSNLLQSLKRSLDEDDVIKHVVTASSEHELKGVFETEIQKHDKYLKELQDNFRRQNELLDTLERVNAEYGQIKLDYRAKQAGCKEKVESIKKFYSQFKATNEGIDKGLEYHNRMLEIVGNFCKNIQADYDLHDLLN